jgi:hypothetical protein
MKTGSLTVLLLRCCFDSVSVDLGRWCGAVALQRAGSPTELMKELMKLAAHADYQHHVWIQGDEE